MQGFRLFLFEEMWKGFKKLIDKADKVYEEIA